ncbi:MAG: glycerophosphodiester phosphodiesterase family protein [Deltaproteobacteria bacterium]|nr:glycerophosphodiester phosphodiesterase family protein [Deltaproteobacteria bacterium]
MSLARQLVRGVLRTPWTAPFDPLLRRAALMAVALRQATDPTLSQSVKRAGKRALDLCYIDGRPLLIGHRGAMARAPENTLGAFQAALDDGARGVELDVTLSGDSVPIVLHDDTLDRTTNIFGKPSDFDVDELAGLDAGSWFPGWGPEIIPSLWQVFEMMPEGAVVNVELKGPTPAYVGLERRVVDVIRAWPRVHVIVSSFHPAQLLEVRRIAPELPIGLLVAEQSFLPSRTAWTAPLLMPDAIHPPAGMVDREFVEGCRAAGLRVHVWSVRSTEEAARLLDLGVDGLIVDDVAGMSVLFG